MGVGNKPVIVDTKSVTSRRKLRFNTLDEFQAEAERLAKMPVRLLGNWTYGQILEHLATAIDCSFDGFPSQAPWFARVFIAPLVKNSMLSKGLPAGFQVPKSAAVLIPEATEIQPALEHLRRSIARYKQGPPHQKHPFFRDLSPQEWVSLTLRHAELHLSFVIPD